MKFAYLFIVTALISIELSACETKPNENQPLTFMLAQVSNSSAQRYSFAELKTSSGFKEPFLVLEPNQQVTNVTVPTDWKGRAQFVILDATNKPRYAIAFAPQAADGNVHVQVREVGKREFIADAYFTPSDIAALRQESKSRRAQFKGILMKMDLGKALTLQMPKVITVPRNQGAQ